MQKAVEPAFSKIFFKLAQIFKIFYHSPLLPKARSMAERCRRKRGVKFSIVFVALFFWIVLSVFSKKPESKLRVFGKSAELN
jgi:hypothetical protein